MKCTVFVYLIFCYCSITSCYQYIYKQPRDFDDIRTRRSTGGGESNNTTKGENKISTTSYYDHLYYNSTYFPHSNFFNDISEMINQTNSRMLIYKHEHLSNAYNKTYLVRLMFSFPFYGTMVENVVVTTKGFINIGPTLHPFIHLVHYFAPLMANFDPSPSKDASIYIASGSDKFIVQWTNIMLNGSKDASKNFTFQIILHKNGSVVFAYKYIPISPLQIPNSTYNVTAGCADGFVMDFLRHDRDKLIIHRYIFTYHKIQLDLSSIKSGTAYMLDLLPNCLQFKSCETCVNASHYTNFKCKWCPILKQCSDSLDWNRQKWLQYKCNINSYYKLSQCPKSLVIRKKQKKEPKNGSVLIGAVVGVLLILLVLAGVSMFFYAYTHPQSKSGMWLIEHRPRRIFKRTFIFKSTFNKVPPDEELL